MKKVIAIIIVLFLLIIIFRGWIYRNTVSYENGKEKREQKITNKELKSEVNKQLFNYKKTKEREAIAIVNGNLKNEIETAIPSNEISINEIIGIAQDITNKNLTFSFKRTSNNPNVVYKNGKANCIGYASLFNSITNYILYKLNKKDIYKSSHLVGEISLLGIDLHQFSNDPFFKNHDYVVIKNIKTKKEIYIDPSLNDYLKINGATTK